MSKLIKEKNGMYIKLNIFEKFFKMNHSERREFIKYLGAVMVGLAGAFIPLSIAFKEYIAHFLMAGIIIIVLSILTYIFLYKKPKNGFGIWWIE